MPIAIYARKSTEGEDRQVQSLEDQRRELRKLAQREGLPEPILYEEARSAKEPGTRPEFARLMEDVRLGKVEGILTWSISRLARNAVDGGVVAHMLQSGRLGFIRTPERTYRPEDNALLLSIENGMAIAYLQDLRRAVVRGMRGKAERGWHSSKPPVGYRADPESRVVVRDDERWDIVRRAFEMALAGETVGAIHRQVVAEGLTIRSRRTKYGPISRSRLHYVLREPFYMGVLMFKGERLTGSHEPMVSEAEFREVQRRLDTPRMVKRPRDAFPYSNTLRCSVCGCAVVGEKRTKHYRGTERTVTYVYYHCTGSKGCSKRGVREEFITGAALPVLKRGAVSPGVAAWIKDALVQAIERSASVDAETFSSMARELEKEELRLKRLTCMRLDGELTPEEYAQMREEISGRVGESKAALSLYREKTGEALRRLHRTLDASVGVYHELALNSDPAASAVGRMLRLVGEQHLNLAEADFRPDPRFAKLAAFEPRECDFQSVERGDLVPLSSAWWTLVEDLLQSDADESQGLMSRPLRGVAGSGVMDTGTDQVDVTSP